MAVFANFESVFMTLWASWAAIVPFRSSISLKGVIIERSFSVWLSASAFAFLSGA